jgi:hypothetical protein
MRFHGDAIRSKMIEYALPISGVRRDLGQPDRE